MALFGILFFGFIISLFSLIWLKKFYRIKNLVDKIQGPRTFPIIGNAHQASLRPDEFFEQIQGLCGMMQKDNMRMLRVWLMHIPFIVIYGAEECEPILGSTKLLAKTMQYNLLSPWIGQGLLISEPKKWRPRRKLLTPTFHYDILKDFVIIYNKHARTLTKKFDEKVDGGFSDIFHCVTLCTLDIICEAALGQCIDAQNKPSSYLNAVMKMKYLIFQRQLQPYFYLDFLFDIFGRGIEQRKLVDILHDLTSKAIHDRKRMADEAGGVMKLLEKEKVGGTRRMAFLDLMLDMNCKGLLSLDGIQEEVDTFTFEGHDTTSTSINWFLHLMGANPSIQSKVQQELDTVFGDSDQDISFENIGSLKFLDCCLKETLRIYPSVPIFARELSEDVIIKGYTIPAGCNVIVCPSMVHRDPKHWKDPEIYRPERFLSKEAVGRHPYAYIPFSAGARNCIGQRFALMEEKCVLSLILRKFIIKAKLRTDQMRVQAELIIRPMYGNEISFRRRRFGQYS